MRNSNTFISGNIGLSSGIFIVFLFLKLTNNIDWSWWWITFPLWYWIPLLLIILVFGIILKNIYREKFRQIDNKLSNINKKSKFQERLEDLQRRKNLYNN